MAVIAPPTAEHPFACHNHCVQRPIGALHLRETGGR